MSAVVPNSSGSASIASIPRPRVALLADFREEGWPSMDLVAEMLAVELATLPDLARVDLLRPAMHRRFTAEGTSWGAAFMGDRLLGRFWDYPRWVRARTREYDLFHVVDHSYAQLSHALPAGRVVVTCHDLDTFRSVLEPHRERRSAPYRWMTRRILDGLRGAAAIVCVSETIRTELLAHGLASAVRVHVVHNGVHPSCTPAAHASADAAAASLLGPPQRDRIDLLHVGSTIARKRIDVLLRVLAALREGALDVRLVRVGGALSSEQRMLAEQLGVSRDVLSLPFLSREVLAAVYRRAALVLQTSSAEGFGLPVAEAMACGTPVLASDLPVLREVGGDATAYAPVADVAAWAAAVRGLLEERRSAPERWRERQAAAVARASAFSWSAAARALARVYLAVWHEATVGRARTPGRGTAAVEARP